MIDRTVRRLVLLAGVEGMSALILLAAAVTATVSGAPDLSIGLALAAGLALVIGG